MSFFDSLDRPAKHWTFNNDPEPPLSPPDDEPEGYCDICGEEIFNDDYMIYGEPVCKECREKWDDKHTIIEFLSESLDAGQEWAAEELMAIFDEHEDEFHDWFKS